MKKTLFDKTWNLAFVRGGMDALFAEASIEVDVVDNPFTNQWFADPFVLDVDDDRIYLLVEEFMHGHQNGRIAKLVINRRAMRIEQCDIILECPTHLSFPNILRHEGKIYVCPENCHSGKLDIYEYDAAQNKLVNGRTICNDAVWDATVTNLLGKCQLFAACQNDYIMDVYDWDENRNVFVPSQTIESPKKDNRMAGQLFEYKGAVYCPTQDCTKTYGGGVWLKRVEQKDGKLALVPVKKIVPPPRRKSSEGLHTLNEYKGVVVVDLKDWIHPAGRIIYNTVRSIIPKKKRK